MNAWGALLQKLHKGGELLKCLWMSINFHMTNNFKGDIGWFKARSEITENTSVKKYSSSKRGLCKFPCEWKEKPILTNKPGLQSGLTSSRGIGISPQMFNSISEYQKCFTKPFIIRNLMSERSKRMRYRIEHEKRNYSSPNNHVLFLL